jgi:hypothetical protein
MTLCGDRPRLSGGIAPGLRRLKSPPFATILATSGHGLGAPGSGGRQAPTASPRQLKEVIQWHIQTLVRSHPRGLWATGECAQADVTRAADANGYAPIQLPC